MRGEPNGWLGQDGATSPVTSPVATGITDVVLAWPVNAIGLCVCAVDADALLKDASNNTVTLEEGQWFAVSGLGGGSTTIDRSGGATRIEFAFQTK